MKRAFTLVELLVALAIILILSSLLFPAFARVRQSAHETETQSDLRQAWLALSLYREDEGDFPSTLDAARWATRVLPACQRGNPWNPQGALMPAPTLGSFGYVRLTRDYSNRAIWESAFPEGNRFLLGSIQFSNPLPLPFEGDAPENPWRQIGPGPLRMAAYPMANRNFGIAEQGALKRVVRPTCRIRPHSIGCIGMSWPAYFAFLEGRF